MTIKSTIKSSISFIIALSVLILSGCTGRAYASSDKSKLETVGRKRLEEYFADNLPDAKIRSVKAVSANREMTLMVLTNYVQGEYSEGAQTYEYYFDVNNRRLFTSKDFYKLRDKIEIKTLKDLNLYNLYQDDKAEILFSNINVYLPDMIEMEDFNRDVGDNPGQMPPAVSVMPYYAPVFPIEAVEDPEAYIYDKDRKEIIDVNMTLTVDASENTDLTKYTFDDFYYTPHDNNIFYRYLCINNAISVTYPRVGYGVEPDIVSKDILKASSQSIKLNSYSIYYELFDNIKSEDTETHTVIYSKSDRLDTDTGNITTKETGDNMLHTSE